MSTRAQEYLITVPADETEAALLAAVDSCFEKALKTGGRAHQGLSANQVARVKSGAPKRAAQLRETYYGELLGIVESYESAVMLATAARSTLGAAADVHLQKIRRATLNAGRRVIRETYRAQWRAGRDAGGNLLALDDAESAMLQRLYRAQQAFFENMLHDIEEGTAKMPLPQRVQLYANCAAEAFWAGLIFSDLSPDVYYQWRMKEPVEHCSDCVMLSTGGRWAGTPDKGTFSARELSRMGVFPGSGKLECCTNCQCGLVRVERPKTAPKGDLWNRVVLARSALPAASSTAGVPQLDRIATPGKAPPRSNVRGHIAKRLLRYKWNFHGRK